MLKFDKEIDLLESTVDLYSDAEAAKPERTLTIAQFMDANRELTPFDVLDILQNLLNEGKHMGSEGSGGTRRIEANSWKKLSERPMGYVRLVDSKGKMLQLGNASNPTKLMLASLLRKKTG
jgi:hypothetical protein